MVIYHWFSGRFPFYALKSKDRYLFDFVSVSLHYHAVDRGVSKVSRIMYKFTLNPSKIYPIYVILIFADLNTIEFHYVSYVYGSIKLNNFRSDVMPWTRFPWMASLIKRWLRLLHFFVFSRRCCYTNNLITCNLNPRDAHVLLCWHCYGFAILPSCSKKCNTNLSLIFNTKHNDDDSGISYIYICIYMLVWNKW